MAGSILEKSEKVLKISEMLDNFDVDFMLHQEMSIETGYNILFYSLKKQIVANSLKKKFKDFIVKPAGEGCYVFIKLDRKHNCLELAVTYDGDKYIPKSSKIRDELGEVILLMAAP